MRFLARTSIIPFVIFIVVLTLRIADPAPIHALRNLVFDSYQRWSPRVYRDAGVRIVDIDDESLQRIGQWPWPRIELAQLLDNLSEMGAKAIALDIIFSEPDRTSPSSLLPLWQRFATAPLPKDLATNVPDYDDVLAQAIARTPTVLGIALTDHSRSHPKPLWGIVTAGADVSPFLIAFNGALENLPVLQSRAKAVGVLNSDPDGDGVIRNVPMVFGLRGGGIYPALSLEALRVASSASTYLLEGSGASGQTAFGQDVGMVGLRVGNLMIPTDGEGRIAVYDTGPEPSRTISAWRVLSGDVGRSQIAGKIIFVGTSATGLTDLRTTPLRTLVPGVEVHAQVDEQILLGTFLLRPNWMTGAELVWMTLVCGCVMWALSRVGPSWAAVIGFTAIAASAVASWIAFRRFGLLVDPIYPAVGALAIYLSQSLLHFIRTERDRRYLKGAFGRYVSPALLEQLVQDSSRLRLGGETREMSIMFCDIRGFTSLSETMDAQALTHFINSFLTPMTERILAHQGTIDKYIGDCVMAFWNAPLPDPLHAERAVRAALDMHSALGALNQRWSKEAAAAGRHFSEVAIGIGIATGPCCVGNLGSEQRFDYSVLGDDVNLASRLESQTKVYGTPLIVSETTQAMIQQFATLELDLLRVKGKLRPTRIFAVLGDEQTAGQMWFSELAEDHHRALKELHNQDWPQAAMHLDALVSKAPPFMRKVYELYRARVSQFANAPPGTWDGVIVADHK